MNAAYPVTLRDMRRYIGAIVAHGRRADFEFPSPIEDAVQALYLARVGYDYVLDVRGLDRLISKHGPHYVVLGRDQAERTEHQIGDDAPISRGSHADADANTHGGNGNSAECEHAAFSAAPNRDACESAPAGGASADTPDRRDRQDGAGTDSPQGEGGQTASRSVDSNAVLSAARSDEGDHGPDEGTGEMGAPRAQAHDTTDTGGAGHAVSAMGGGGSPEAREDHCAATGQGEPEREAGNLSARKRVSGRDAEAPRPTTIRAVAADIAAARIATSLSRLTDVVGRKTDRRSPRIDGAALVRELVSRRGNLQRVYRPDPAPQGMLVMPDLSGSCEWISAVTSPLAERVAARAHMAVAPHGLERDEGVVTTARGNRSICAAVQRVLDRNAGAIDTPEAWRALRAAGISHILVLGDSHGHVQYAYARDAGVTVIWLDPNPDMMVGTVTTDGMVYEPITTGEPSAMADAFERATRRVRRQ